MNEFFLLTTTKGFITWPSMFLLENTACVMQKGLGPGFVAPLLVGPSSTGEAENNCKVQRKVMTS